MHISSIHKKIAVAFIMLAMMASAYGAFAVPTARAESNSGTAVSASNETIITLLKQLIQVLQEQLKALQESKGIVAADDDKDEEDDKDCSTNDQGLGDVEATIYTNETVIEIEFNGKKEIVVTDADTEAEIINAIQDEHDSLTDSEVKANLEIEEEDRASRSSDKIAEDSDEDCDAEDDADEDEDEDDDEEDEEDDDSDDDEDEDEDEDDD